MDWSAAIKVRQDVGKSRLWVGNGVIFKLNVQCCTCLMHKGDAYKQCPPPPPRTQQMAQSTEAGRAKDIAWTGHRFCILSATSPTVGAHAVWARGVLGRALCYQAPNYIGLSVPCESSILWDLKPLRLYCWTITPGSLQSVQQVPMTSCIVLRSLSTLESEPGPKKPRPAAAVVHCHCFVA